LEEVWNPHPEFNLGTASVPVLDVNGDGRNELIAGPNPQNQLPKQLLNPLHPLHLQQSRQRQPPQNCRSYR
jgi:hypothetical protein